MPLQKTIGQAKPEVVPSLIVMNARAATLEGTQLTLTGVAPNSIMFADRPVRAAGHALTTHLLEEWSPGDESSDSFAKDPPNATVSAFSKDGSVIRDAVVVLKAPKLEGDKLTFDVQVLEGSLEGADGPASIFIDRFGGHFGGGGHFSGFHGGGFDRGGFDRDRFAGAARRTAYRGAWYRGAAVGAAAVGVGAAAAWGAPYYNSYQCGYYPYPPCN
jgi:hypothetical protein